MTRLRLFFLIATLTACSVFSNPIPTPLATEAPPTVPLSTAAPIESSAPPATEPVTAPPATETPSPAPASIAPPDPACCTLVPFVSGLRRPVLVTYAGDERLFTLEQRGRVRLITADGQLLDDPFLDVSGLIDVQANEQGLLGLAFHPNYARNGHFYINYTDLNGDTVVARYIVSSDPYRADPDSAEVLLTIGQPYANHNGGGIVFGPDGLLYIGMGDGGSAGDPEGNGQNPEALLGKMLRLDVDTEGTPPEIWAMGLRNPWRFSFDRLTGDLFIGDVGQGDWEEIDYVAAPLPPPGINFGWNILEGTHRYSTFGDVAGLTGPIAEYAQSEGGCSVISGYVYRGGALPSLTGNYFFGDYCTGIIWSLTPNAQGAWDRAVFTDTDYTLSSFGEDVNGELYVVDHIGGTIYRLTGE